MTAEGAHDGQDEGEAGNDGGAEVPQEQEDDEDDEADGEDEGELDVVDGLADGLGPVVEDLHLDGGGQLLGEGRQQVVLDGLDDLDRVGAWLALDRKDDRAYAVETTPRRGRSRRCR